MVKPIQLMWILLLSICRRYRHMIHIYVHVIFHIVRICSYMPPKNSNIYKYIKCTLMAMIFYSLVAAVCQPPTSSCSNFNDIFHTIILIGISPVDHPITHRKRWFLKTTVDEQNSIENVSDYRINYSKPFEVCTSHLRQAHFMQCKISSTFQPFHIQIYTNTYSLCRRLLLDIALILKIFYIRIGFVLIVWNCFIWFIGCTISR